MAYLYGQGIEWPWLSFATPLSEYAWNVPIAFSGAVACLFTREIADLRHTSSRVYRMFGWLAWAFVVLAAANVAKYVGLLSVVNAVGNIICRHPALHRRGVLHGMAARQCLSSP